MKSWDFIPNVLWFKLSLYIYFHHDDIYPFLALAEMYSYANPECQYCHGYYLSFNLHES